MNKKLWYIQQLDLFKGLAKEKLKHVESFFSMREYRKKEVIFEPGDKDKVFIVKTGQVELYQLSLSGKKLSSKDFCREASLVILVWIKSRNYLLKRQQIPMSVHSIRINFFH